MLAWGEAWFLDCRVLPQERYARAYFQRISVDERTPLVAPSMGNTESIANFYSPYASLQGSSDDEQYKVNK